MGALPADATGHFGMSGTYLWLAGDYAMVALTDREFGDWQSRCGMKPIRRSGRRYKASNAKNRLTGKREKLPIPMEWGAYVVLFRPGLYRPGLYHHREGS